MTEPSISMTPSFLAITFFYFFGPLVCGRESSARRDTQKTPKGLFYPISERLCHARSGGRRDEAALGEGGENALGHVIDGTEAVDVDEEVAGREQRDERRRLARVHLLA